MDFRNILEQTVHEIFSNMVMLDITTLAEAPAPMSGDMLTGMIGLAGDLQGSILVHLPTAVAIAITSAFLGLELDAVDDDVKDAVGEMANMVAGGVKYLLPPDKQDVALAIPSVVYGKGYSCEATGRFETTSVQFELESGRFTIEIQTRAQVIN